MFGFFYTKILLYELYMRHWKYENQSGKLSIFKYTTNELLCTIIKYMTFVFGDIEIKADPILSNNRREVEKFYLRKSQYIPGGRLLFCIEHYSVLWK